MKLLVLGWYENFNIGDESYKITFPILFPHHNFTFTNTLTDDMIQKSDAIFLGGGSILDDIWLEKLKKYHKIKPIYAFSVGNDGKKASKDRLSILDHIIVRDESSQNYLKKIDINSVYAPDTSFALTPNMFLGSDFINNIFEQENTWRRKKTIAITINSYLPRDGRNQLAKDEIYFQKFSYDIADIIDKIDANFIFLPFCQKLPWDDRVSNSWIAMKCVCPQKNVVVFDRINPQQAIDIISACDAIVSTRLHSTIFGIISGTPFLDIYHNEKNQSFLKMIDFGERISYWDYTKNDICNSINRLLSEEKNKHLNKVNELKEILFRTYKEVNI